METEKEEITTSEDTLTDEQDVSSAGGEKEAGTQVEDNASETVEVKDVLNELLGKEFTTDEEALKAVKDTFSHIGVKTEATEVVKELRKQGVSEDKIVAAIKTLGEDFASKEDIKSLQRDVSEKEFYAENPEYKPYQSLIRKLGNNPEEVVKSDDFKPHLEKLLVQDETAQSQSIVQSNPRLGKVSDKMTKAREALEAGNEEVAGEHVTDAVIDTFEMR